MAHCPFLKDVIERPAQGDRHLVRHAFQLGAVGVNKLVGARLVAILEHPQTNGRGALVPVFEQLGGFGQAAISAQATHLQACTEKMGVELKVMRTAAQTDADHGFDAVHVTCLELE